MSSAARSSATIVRASPYTRRWNRRTNAEAASRSPEANPATSASSETVHTRFYVSRCPRDCTEPEDVTVAGQSVPVPIRRPTVSLGQERLVRELGPTTIAPMGGGEAG